MYMKYTCPFFGGKERTKESRLRYLCPSGTLGMNILTATAPPLYSANVHAEADLKGGFLSNTNSPQLIQVVTCDIPTSRGTATK